MLKGEVPTQQPALRLPLPPALLHGPAQSARRGAAASRDHSGHWSACHLRRRCRRSVAVVVGRQPAMGSHGLIVFTSRHADRRPWPDDHGPLTVGRVRFARERRRVLSRRGFFGLAAGGSSGVAPCSRRIMAWSGGADEVPVRKTGKVEIAFKSPGPQPNGLQATREGCGSSIRAPAARAVPRRLHGRPRVALVRD